MINDGQKYRFVCGKFLVTYRGGGKKNSQVSFAAERAASAAASLRLCKFDPCYL